MSILAALGLVAFVGGAVGSGITFMILAGAALPLSLPVGFVLLVVRNRRSYRDTLRRATEHSQRHPVGMTTVVPRSRPLVAGLTRLNSMTAREDYYFVLHLEGRELTLLRAAQGGSIRFARFTGPELDSVDFDDSADLAPGRPIISARIRSGSEVVELPLWVVPRGGVTPSIRAVLPEVGRQLEEAWPLSRDPLMKGPGDRAS